MFNFRVRNGNGLCHGAKPPKPNIQYIWITKQYRLRRLAQRGGASRANFQQKIMRTEQMILFRNSVNINKKIFQNPAERDKLYKFPNRNQTISTSRLNALPRLHLKPIKVVICDLSMISNLGAGFSLRCFQRLSHPDIATRRCPWQDSRHTRGRSTLILSYREQSSSKI